jgi:RNA polymerase sigma factor (sigma-70 family)
LSCGLLRVVNILDAADSGISCDGTPEGNQVMTAEASTATTRPGPATSRAATECNDAIITDLVSRARNGDKQAWDALVERYAPLIWSICRKYELRGADAEDVGQSVWLHLVDHLDRVRDPAALPGWLATTTRRECARVLRAAGGPHDAGQVPSTENTSDEQVATPEEELLAAERHAALREALMGLPPCCQQLIALLIEDPPVPYLEISARLGIPVGSIGPHRRRCLDKLRRAPAIAALISGESETAT